MKCSKFYGHDVEKWSRLLYAMHEVGLKDPEEVADFLISQKASLVEITSQRNVVNAKLYRIKQMLEGITL